MKKIIVCLLLLHMISFIPLFSGCFQVSEAAALDIMLPKIYASNIEINGWLLSEKLDGVRGYWDGQKLFSKHGKQFHPPAAFTRNFPSFALEGEIWGGRGTFEQTVGIVKRHASVSRSARLPDRMRRDKPDKGWLKLKFAIFDVPKAAGGFVQRLQKAQDWFAENHADYAFVIPQKTVRNKDDLQKELHRVESLGGEGLIVRKPNALYTVGRSSDILKVKSYQDMEAVVISHVPGSGKNAGRLGALLVELPDGKKFKIGTGFSDAERENPPPIGSTITFKYYGLYQSGLPKFASFLRVRGDEGL